LAILPFDSDRKRMSIIVKSITGEIKLFCKGADEVVFSKFSKVYAKAKEINDIFAKQGYRTLIMGTKQISEFHFNNWFKRYNEILNDMHLNQAQKHNQLTEIFEEVEIDMEYLGCSAIEDKLQDEVDTTIQLLKEAGIKIWMLTGDKVENSIEVAKMCNLLSNERCIYFTLNNIKSFEEFQVNIEMYKEPIIFEYCLILDGKTLAYYERLEEENRKGFIKILTNCTSAICCRLTPKQKSQMVRILKKVENKVTLSVGDGANDVPMILEANIGIGISGKEGTQAVRSADYSISQFKFLRDILLVHGRLAYKRLSLYTCYAFYKNVIVVFTEIYFIIFNGFSGQIYFSDWFTNFYNTFWSSWPMVINFTLDRDVEREISLKYPSLYKAGHCNKYMNPKIFWTWTAFAMFHGAILFWIPMLNNHFMSEPDGKIKDHWWTSSLSFTILLHIVTIKLFLATDYWNYLSL
jgi:phospholipid-transporting ATPase